MTTITEVLKRVARQVSVSQPSSWVTTTDARHVEIRDDFLIETVEDILDRIDLPSPIGAVATITGTGAATYALPADFLRLQRGKLAVYDPGLDRACLAVTDDGEWTALTDSASGAERYFRLTGYRGNHEIEFYAPPSADINVHYVTTNWMVSSGGTAGSALMAEDDIILLPNRLVETGIVWRWRERKGLPYQDKFSEHEILMTRHSNDIRGRRQISFGPRKAIRWQDNVPSQIPDA